VKKEVMQARDCKGEERKHEENGESMGIDETLHTVNRRLRVY
jgi:hypothetical protein